MDSGIVITGWIDYEPDDRGDVLKHFAECARISRGEPGCLDYAVSADLDNEGRVRVIEHWVSDDALMKHLQLEHVTAFRAAIAERKAIGRDLRKHVLASSGPMTSSSAR